MTLSCTTQINEMINRGALFMVNHSGGKDSQAMTIALRNVVPLDQLVIVHAELPEVDWPGTVEFIETNALGIEVRVCKAVKTFFEMVEHRQKFPSPSTKQCTSDLKRGPLEKLIRTISLERKNKLIVNCMGMRAAESPGRAKQKPWKYSKRNSKAGREYYDALPVHHWSTDEVFREIADANQEPFYTYGEGMIRKSCCFCIMACKSDLKIAARLMPELASRYIETEERLDFSMNMSRTFLREIITQNNNITHA